MKRWALVALVAYAVGARVGLREGLAVGRAQGETDGIVRSTRAFIEGMGGGTR